MEICKNYLKIIPSDLVLISPLQKWALQILRIYIWFDYWFIQNFECTGFRFYFVRGYFRWSPISFSFCLLSLPPSLTEILLFENLIKDYHFYLANADAKQPLHIFEYCYRQINVFCNWIKKHKKAVQFLSVDMWAVRMETVAY